MAKNWIAEKINNVPIGRIKPYAKNARTHSDHQIALLVAAIQEFGFTTPILMTSLGDLVAGHGRLEAAKILGMTHVPAIFVDHLSERQRRALVLADNKIAELAGWDFAILADEINALADMDYDLDGIGFNEQELEQLLKDGADLIPNFEITPRIPKPLEKPRALPKSNTDTIDDLGDFSGHATRLGAVWIMGEHRLMCGDSLNAEQVAELMAGDIATLVHSDPPYGMGKESDGVAGDNQYREKLDAFQLAWWKTYRRHLADNGSAYIWGNAEDLWRLWFVGGLKDTEDLSVRNEIVWDKKSIAGMASPLMTQYPTASERCLFIQIGQQFLGNVNQWDFPETWAPILDYLRGEADRMEITPKKLREITGVQMYSHWFTRSQFSLIPETHYLKLAEKFPEAFRRKWITLKELWDEVKSGPTSEIQKRRSYFNNAHDIMRDVWEFPRVFGDERHDHSTPKPVAMMERAIISSSQEGDVVAEPFGGSGSTLIACEQTGRKARVMELVPKFCDITVQRWQKLTGLDAVDQATGKTFNQLANG